jgi:hypothetical protein
MTKAIDEVFPALLFSRLTILPTVRRRVSIYSKILLLYQSAPVQYDFIYAK